MSSNQPPRRWARAPALHGRGRGREGDVEEGAPYLKKARPAKIGDALRVFPSPTRSSDSPPSCERQPAGSQAHPVRPNNQPVRGWGGGGGQGGAPASKEVNQPVRDLGGGGGQGDAPDSKEVQDARHEAKWLALPDPTGSSSSQPSPTKSQLQTSQPSERNRNAGVANFRKENESSSSSSAFSPPQSQAQIHVVNSKWRHPRDGNQLEGWHDVSTKNTSSSSSSARSTPQFQAQINEVDSKERHPRDGKQLEGRRDRSAKNTPSSSSSASAHSTPQSQVKKSQLRERNCNAGGAVKERLELSAKNTPSPSSSGGSTPRFTSPKEQITQLKNTQLGERNCNAGGAVKERPELSTKNTPSPSSSGGSTPRFTSPKEQISQLSYISVLEKGLDPGKIERLSKKLSVFLNTFTENGGAFPYYQAELHAIKLRSPFRLTLEFKHMIQYDIELAFETWKCQGNTKDWILPSVQTFLKLHKYGSEDEIMSKTCLALAGFPSSMKKVTDVLKTATYPLELFGGQCRVCEAKADGKLVLHLFFTAAFARHAKDLSWDGNFSVNDMFIVNNAELHICRPCVVATGPSRLRDIQKGGQQLLPFFKGPAGYPAYFDQLEEDLGQTNSSEIKEPWCAEYFCFHMAGLSSMARRNFELALHHVPKTIDIDLDGIFGMLTSEIVTNWQEYIKNSGCEPLKTVLDYIDPATGEPVKYENTIGGLVKYKRHFLEHTLFGRIFDVNELELFGANKFGKHLPGTVKLLLRRKRMSKCFGAAWSSLKSSRFDGRDTPCKQ